jgi:Na+-translocating ferredoxin:NAD+ oxidoreductase RnfG subunit
MHQPPVWLIAPALAAFATAPAYAVQYLNIEQAQKQFFPQADSFASVPVELSSEQKAFVEKNAGVRMRYSKQPVWKALDNGRHVGWVVQDEVFGKHEFITYAVALDPAGTVLGVEILDYRETHGREVRNANWRAQFNGKKHGAPLRLDNDIQNISGATLSCKHISEGVRRILALHEAALK